LNGIETLEPHHRTRDSLYLSMILLDNVIEDFALPNLNPFIIVLIILFDSRRVSATVIDVNQTGLSISTDRYG
jgi:hypothetical protein